MSVTRLGRDVQAVFAVAYESASDGSRTVIGKEHILVAALEAPLGAAWLPPLTAPQVRADVLPAVARARAAGGLSAADRAALGSIGIDLVFLEQRVSSLGMGEAIARPARPSGGGHQHMTDYAAVMLGRAEDLALAGGRHGIGLPELVMALVEVPSLITEHLNACGVSAESVRQRQQERRA